MADEDMSVLEKYQLAQQYRDPSKRYAPDKNDPPTRDKKDKDKDPRGQKKPDKVHITRVLVRNEDGTIGVQFQDAQTGRPIKNPYADNKDIETAGDFSDVFGKKKKKKSTDNGDGGEDKPPIVGYTDKGDPIYETPGGYSYNGPNPARSSGPSTQQGKTVASPSSAQASFTQPSEQGDMTDAATDYGYNDPAKDPDYQVNGSFAPAEVALRDFQSEVAANKKENAQFASLDGDSFDTIQGNNPHPLEGVNLNDTKSIVASREWDDATIDKAARTLAGELPGNIDLSTPEGQREARAILSTIENRDIANGPTATAMDAITAPDQYSTWNDEKGINVATNNFEARPDEFTKTVQDYLQDPNSNLGFTSYHAPYVNPAWSDDMKDVENIGGHKFGTLPEYTSKMQKYTAPISDEQKNQVATDVINQNFEQGFAAPVGNYLSQNTPEINTSGVQTAGNMAAGINAQRDYNPVQQIKEDLTVQGPLSTVGPMDTVASINNQYAMDNAFGIQQGQQIANTAPTIEGPQETASRSLPTITDTTGITDGFSTAPSISQENFDSRFSGTPSISQEDFDSRFSGTPTITQENFDSRFSGTPSISQQDFDSRFSGAPVSDKTMGFGDYVSATNNTTAGLTDFQKDVADARINDQVSQNNAQTISAGMDIASTAPSVAETANAVDSMSTGIDASTATSAGEGSGVTSTSGVGVASTSGGESSGGFASASSTDSSGVSTGGFSGTSGSTDASVDAEAESGGSDGFL